METIKTNAAHVGISKQEACQIVTHLLRSKVLLRDKHGHQDATYPINSAFFGVRYESIKAQIAKQNEVSILPQVLNDHTVEPEVHIVNERHYEALCNTWPAKMNRCDERKCTTPDHKLRARVLMRLISVYPCGIEAEELSALEAIGMTTDIQLENGKYFWVAAYNSMNQQEQDKILFMHTAEVKDVRETTRFQVNVDMGIVDLMMKQLAKMCPSMLSSWQKKRARSSSA